jgi:hypothetical protein
LRPLFLLLILAISQDARAGWVQPPGAYYLKIWDRTLIGDRVFDLDGERPELPESYQDHALNLYAEYGVTEELTVLFHGSPIGYSSIGDESTVYSGLNWFGLRHALLRGTVPLALELKYGYSPPLGDGPLAEGTLAGARFVYRPTFEQHLGRAQLSAGWGSSSVWVKTAAAAILSSADDIDPALEAALAVGWRSSFGLAATIDLLLHVPVRDPRVIDVTGFGNTRYLGVELTLAWWLNENVAINVAAGGAPALTTSNAATPALSFGVEIRS